jgi:Na+/phosphate symporter
MIRDGWTFVGYKLQNNAENQLPIGTIIDPTRRYIKQDLETWDLIRKEQEEKHKPIADANLKRTLDEIKMIKIIDEYMNKIRTEKKKKQKAITKKEKEKRQKRISELEKEINKYKQKISRYKRNKSRK